MFRDMDLCKDLMVAFKSSDAALGPGCAVVDRQVLVLTTGFWPPYPPSAVVLPEALTACQVPTAPETRSYGN